MKRSKLDAPQDCWNYAFIYLFYCRIGGSIILIGNLSADRTSPQKIRICGRHAKLAAGYSSKKGSHNWLVVWNMFYFSCWEQNFPIWLSYFSEGLKLTTNQIMTCFWASPGGRFEGWSSGSSRPDWSDSSSSHGALSIAMGVQYPNRWMVYSGKSH